MTIPDHNPIGPNTEGRIQFDAGALWRNYTDGSSGGVRVGATRGGATFTVDKEDRMAEIDGMLGPIKGLRRPIRITATLEATLVEISEQTWANALRGTSSSDGTHFTITPDSDIVDADYLDNIALVADTSDGEDCILILKNPLVSGEFDLSTDDEDEGQMSLTWEAHYESATATTPPFEIKWPVGMS